MLLLNSISCADYVEGVNENPNDPTNATIENLMTSAQVNLIGIYEGEDARLASMWAQQFTGSDRQYTSLYGYITSSESFSWFDHYIGIIQPSNDALPRVQALGNTSTEGVLKIMKAMTFGKLTSLYGDIPFSEANKSPQISNPRYDDQAAVYAGIQTMLDEAINNLTIGDGPILVDLLGNGSIDNWIAVAHTLKARYYLHVGNFANAINEAELGLSATDYGLVGQHGVVASGNQNLWYDFHEINRSGYITAEDALLPKMLDADRPEYRGNAKTDETNRFSFIYVGTAPGNYDLNVDDGMFAVDAPYPILTGVENQLILAEALLKQATPDEQGALDALNNVREYLDMTFPEGMYDPYVLTDFDPSGIAGKAGQSRSQALLQEIIEEKYVSLVGQIEVFNDQRRLDNPLGLTPVSGSQLPQRFLIPTNEVNANANVPNPIPDLFEPTDVNK